MGRALMSVGVAVTSPTSVDVEGLLSHPANVLGRLRQLVAVVFVVLAVQQELDALGHRLMTGLPVAFSLLDQLKRRFVVVRLAHASPRGGRAGPRAATELPDPPPIRPSPEPSSST